MSRLLQLRPKIGNTGKELGLLQPFANQIGGRESTNGKRRAVVLRYPVVSVKDDDSNAEHLQQITLLATHSVHFVVCR